MVMLASKDFTATKKLPLVAEVDPGFPVGGVPTLHGGTNIRFCQIFQKTASNRENFGLCVCVGGGDTQGAPSRSANEWGLT